MGFLAICTSSSSNPEEIRPLHVVLLSCTKRCILLGTCCYYVLMTDVSYQAGQQARLTSKSENRGVDGRGFAGPGLDHGVFIPFRIMFGDEFLDVPIVQVSIDESMDPETNWALGKAIAKLR
jgi:hypothetical protein